MFGREKYVIQNINQINIAKYTGLVVGINFILGGFYKGIYFFALGIDAKRIELSLIDYIRFGLDLLPIVTLVAMYAIFSIKPPKPPKPKTAPTEKVNTAVGWVGRLWIPEIMLFVVFVLFKTGKIDSVFTLLAVVLFPLVMYFVHRKRLEKIIKVNIPFFYKFLIKFVILILVLFSVMGAVDGTMDKNGQDNSFYSINLRTKTQLAGKNEGNTVDGYILKSFDNVTIFKIYDKITIVNNGDIMNVVKKK